MGGSRAPLVVACLLAVAPTPLAGKGRVPASKSTAERRRLARSLFVDGRRHYNLKRFARALRLFRKSYRVLPLPGFLYNIAQCHRYLGDCKNAIFYYARYLRESRGAPNSALVRELIAGCQRRLERTKKRRSESQAQFEAGRQHLRLGEIQQALDRFKRAYRAYPLAGYLFQIGSAQQRLKQYEKAIASYRGYLQDNPGTPQTSMVKARIAECERLAAARRRLRRPRLVSRPGSVPPVSRRAARPKPPLYRRWWFWTVIGLAAAAVAAGAAGAAIATSSRGSLRIPAANLGVFDWSDR